MKKLLIICLALAVLASCRREDSDGISASSVVLNGTNAVPSNTSTGTGLFEYSYNDITKIFSYKLTYSGLADSATQFGIAKAAPGQVLPASIFQLPSSFTGTSLQRRQAASYSGNFPIDGFAMTLAEIRSGNYCVFLRSKAYSTGSGEIRAQIKF